MAPLKYRTKYILIILFYSEIYMHIACNIEKLKV